MPDLGRVWKAEKGMLRQREKKLAQSSGNRNAGSSNAFEVLAENEQEEEVMAIEKDEVANQEVLLENEEEEDVMAIEKDEVANQATTPGSS